MRIAVIGAGPAGLTAGYVLGKNHFAVDVYEASDAVGGMARSLSLWGQTVDIGPHRFFSRDRRVNELWLEVVQGDYSVVKRRTRILYQDKFFKYPLEPLNALASLGLFEAARCMASYAREKVSPGAKNGTFESWVCNRFGRRLFEIFFKTYSEKLWGIPCNELDADFAAQRIKKFSLSVAIKNAVSRNGSEHRTLSDQFAYAWGGTGTLYSRMADRIRQSGGRVFLKSPIDRVVMKNGRVAGLKLADGTVREYDHVISSMPLTQLASRLPDAPVEVLAACGRLSFRNTIIVYLEARNDSVCDDNWIYVHSPELRTGRVTNFRNWVPQLCGNSPNTILAMEYWCNETDALWRMPEEELVRLARRELVATGLVENESLISRGMVYRVPKCYPVYLHGYRDHLATIQECLSGIDRLQVIGRYGAFKYNNQDHSILMGLLAAENALGATHDLWDINADYDTYQESSSITETGLVHSNGSNRKPVYA